MNAGGSRAEEVGSGPGEARFATELMLSAARLYYLEDASQADIARQLGTSRATVSRMLSEARRRGIVTINVNAPQETDHGRLAEDLARHLGLEAAYVTPGTAESLRGPVLAEGVARALSAVTFDPGDVLLVSTGRTVYEVAQGELPRLPGVVVTPMIGGHDEPDAWYQPNEIARLYASRVDGYPTFLYAPALPGPDLHRILVQEPSIQRVLDLWRTARCAVVGIGAPPLSRSSIPRFIPTDAMSLRAAVGDVCSRFYDRDGKEVPFPGSECLMSTELEVLRTIPTTIGVAVGLDKLSSITVGARAGYFRQLVTDTVTAEALLSVG